MKTEFLKNLGIDDEIIKQIMAENGKDIEKTKETLNSQITDLNSQLSSTKEALKGFEGVDVNELKGKIEKLTTDLTTKETEYQNKIADMEFNSKLDSLITSTGARNAKAVKALLDLDSLKSSKNQDTDLQTALEACKTENGFMFGADEPILNPTASTGGSLPQNSPLDSIRTAMGLSTETKK